MLNTHDIASFSELASRWKSAIRSLRRTYIATRSENGWILRHGIFSFSPELPIPRDDHLFIATKSIRAGTDAVAIKPDEVDRFVDSVVTGCVTVSAGGDELTFGNCELDSHFYTYHHPRASFSMRSPSLVITARQNVNTVDGAEVLDLDIRSHEQPFDGMQDLIAALGIPIDPRYNSNSVIEIILPGPAMIADDSQINSERLSIALRASPTIKKENIKIGVRAYSASRTNRFTLRSDSVEWAQVGDWLHGRCEHTLPGVSHAQCFLSYGDDFLQSWWITDPSKALNKRVGIYTLFDHDRRALRELLYPERSRARDIEHGVAQLMALHGFIVTRIGRTSDAPDVLAETPSGKLLVIECTTDLPDKGDKLTKLIQRTVKISEHASRDLQPYLEIQAVLVTNLTEAESKPHHDLAVKNGVALVCKEQIEELLGRLDAPANPDRIFEEAKQLASQGQGELFQNGLQAR